MVRNCPFLTESDILSLSVGVTPDGTVLHDVPIGAKHTIHPPGEHVLHALAQGVSFRKLQAIALRHHIAERDVHELLGLLNTIGALKRQRTPWLRLRALGLQASHLLLGIRYATLSWRRNATLHTIAIALMRASWPVVIASAVTCGLVAATGVVSVAIAYGVGAYVLALLLASLLIHEMTHLHYIKAQQRGAIVLQRGMRLGIAHPALPPRVEIATAVAGPAAGIIACTSAALVCWIAGKPLLGIASLCVGSFHLGSLLPWYSDGATIFKVLRGRRHA